MVHRAGEAVDVTAFSYLRSNIFWVALNMIYSDYVKVAKKFGVGDKIDFYVDMAKAFLDDKDAGPDKLARYYKYIVR